MGTSAVIMTGGTFFFNNANTYTLNAPISGFGNLTVQAGAYAILNGVGTYTGNTTIGNATAAGSTVQIGVNNALSTVAQLTLNAGTLDLHGFNQQVGALIANTVIAGAVPANYITNNGPAGSLSVFTVNTLLQTGNVNGALTATTNVPAANTFNSVFNGSIEDGAGQVALVKIGLGQLTLTGPNPYTGGTTILAGTLTVVAPTGVAGFSPPSLGTGPLTITNLNTGAGASTILALNNGAQTVGSLNAGILPGATLATPSSGLNTAQISLGSGTILTINQTVNGAFDGNITGSTGSLVLGAASTATLTLGAYSVSLNGVN